MSAAKSGNFFDKLLTRAYASGIDPMRLAFDPGIGFGKTVAHNLALLRNLDSMRVADDRSCSASRAKSFLGKVSRRSTAMADRDWPTVALTSYGAEPRRECLPRPRCRAPNAASAAHDRGDPQAGASGMTSRVPRLCARALDAMPSRSRCSPCAIYFIWLLFRGHARCECARRTGDPLPRHHCCSRSCSDCTVISWIARSLSALLVVALVDHLPTRTPSRASPRSGVIAFFFPSRRAAPDGSRCSRRSLSIWRIASSARSSRSSASQNIEQLRGDRRARSIAELSPELVVRSFFPKTPLHDGGVIIRNDRIVSAACIFPVSQRGDLDRILGLRHRAALGLDRGIRRRGHRGLARRRASFPFVIGARSKETSIPRVSKPRLGESARFQEK